MKILVVSQYFWPESFFINTLCYKLKSLGHELCVVTGKPNYPEGQVYEGYDESGVLREFHHGIEIIRVPLRSRKSGALGLLLNYLSFVVSGLKYMPRMLKDKEFDVIFVYGISPITAAIPAIFEKRRSKAHLALWVQDLWPASLAATGYINNKIILSLVDLMVGWIYRQCDTLLGQSHAFVEELKQYEPEEKVHYYPTSIERAAVVSDIDDTLDLSCFDDAFTAVFAGNIGSAQAIPTIIDAAELLRDSTCRIVIVGAGSLLDWAKQEISERKLDNMFFLGRVEPSYMQNIYEKAGCLLVTLSKEDTFAKTIPGKVPSCLESGLPIVGAVDGEPARVLLEAGAGIVVPAEDSRGLADAIVQTSRMSTEERLKIQSSARRYFHKHFDIETQAASLVEILEGRIRELAS